MNIKLLKKIKQINNVNNSKVIPVTNANILVTEDSIKLETEGKLSTMIIQYTGAVYFNRLLSSLVKVNTTKNSILITNIFKMPIQGDIFTYSGDLKITKCQIFNYDQTYINATIDNVGQEEYINAQKTNIDNDDAMLYDTVKKSRRHKNSRGFNKPYLDYSQANTSFKNLVKKDIPLIAKVIEKTLTVKTQIKQQPTKVVVQPTKATPTIIVDKKGKY